MSSNSTNPTGVGPEANAEQEELPASLAAHYDRLDKLIQRAHGTFLRELPELLKSHRGKRVAYHGDKRLGFGRDITKLMKHWHARGVPQGELGIFLVVPHTPDDDIEWFGVD